MPLTVLLGGNWDRGNVIMSHVVFTTPSTKAVIIPRLLLGSPGSSNVGGVLRSNRGGWSGRKVQMMGTNWKRWKGN